MAAGAGSVIVETASGRLSGISADGVDRFLGIPYAAPPVGELRWRSSEPVESWSGVREAASFGPDAMQRARPATSRAPGIDEDCLTLNVWAPSDRSVKRPVMVWFFGGSFIGGSAADLRTGGEGFARDGVVFVTVNSRVGIFGWLAHPELTAESDHGGSGNYGMLDQIMALRWIRENIAAFGGDPTSVTVFGVSSGGASLALLITSPLANGLFDRAILQSAGSFRPLADLAQAEAAGQELGSLAALRALSANDVLALEPKLIPVVRGLTTPRILRPIRDGRVLPLNEREAYESGRINPVDAIVGSNADEGSKLTATWPIADIAGWERLIESNFAKRIEDARRLYPAWSDDQVPGAVADMFGDTQFQLGARELGRCLERQGAKAYRYVFTKRRDGMADGPHHGGEVPYVFGHFDLPPFGDQSQLPDAQDRALSGAMRAAWINFASTGSPGAIEGVAWPVFADGFLELGEEVGVGTEWRAAQLDFLNDYARL